MFPTSVMELAGIVEEELGITSGNEIVGLALQELEEAHLLETTSGWSTGQKVALAGAVALLVPVVETLIAPPASAAASFSYSI